MSLMDKVRGLLSRSPKNLESDVAEDSHVAQSRATGGVDGDAGGDSASTTGTAPSEEFVGRVAGQDEGDVGLSGAEARALDTQPKHDESHRTS